MGRTVRQKRKGRSSRPVVRQSNARKRPVNPTGNVIIAQNWDKSLTLTQNYRRLGLMNRLKKPSGGVERLGTDAVSERASARPKEQELARHADPFKIENKSAAAARANAAVREVRVERDAEGRIVRIVDDTAPAHNPLNDPLNDLEDEFDDGDGDDDDDDEEVFEEWGGFEDETKPGKTHKASALAAPAAPAKTPVVAALEKMANRPMGPKQPRHQSSGERDWLQTLVDHYGQADPSEDTLAAMARDRRRNPFQRTVNDLRRRLAAFRAQGGTVGVSS